MSDHLAVTELSPAAGEYDCVYSLGMDCRPRHIMKYLDLKSRRGPFDWIGGRSVAALIDALQSQCQHVLKKAHLEPYDTQCKEYKKYWDPVSQYLSTHDFALIDGNLEREYPAFRAKFDGISARFFTHIKHSKRVLFFLNIGIESHPDFEPESITELLSLLPQLQRCLTSLCGGEATLLVATFHEQLAQHTMAHTHFVIKQTFADDTPWMEGAEYQLWASMLAGVCVPQDTTLSHSNSGFIHCSTTR
ncbi:hypothetical protein PCIT_b0939 [Pseudoalteromonas citrea]|uniref:Papain-like cysteine peptidase n=2 Tax=Pseudoalteromonas citrea TaxID=43655 RepID=A0AAD4FQA1_9GAMM|nr:DUF1796 family putative cysteine peptidase [Pseudoalteromonas citrea]KAF7764852.1 hypothetical protein PCIT_b0939 [Pseudoalteromonas citrea]